MVVIDVRFESVINAFYRVEWSDDLSLWQEVPGATNVPGQFGTTTITHSIAGGSTLRTYRVLQVLQVPR